MFLRICCKRHTLENNNEQSREKRLGNLPLPVQKQNATQKDDHVNSLEAMSLEARIGIEKQNENTSAQFGGDHF
tara:strand:- start:434 stop:655 length:222 start_codon:yes stop_codon:yes gene_type:complete